MSPMIQKPKLIDTISLFLQKGMEENPELERVIRELASRYDLYLFGGAIRELALTNSVGESHDLDLVVVCDDLKQIESALGLSEHKHFTVFGGIRFNAGDRIVDIWPLRRTWAFEFGYVTPATPKQLPKTTQFNVDAATAKIDEKGNVLEFYDAGLLKAMNKKIIEVNLAEFPYPDSCAMKAKKLIQHTGFAVGPKLYEFLANCAFIDAAKYELAHVEEDRDSK